VKRLSGGVKRLSGGVKRLSARRPEGVTKFILIFSKHEYPISNALSKLAIVSIIVYTHTFLGKK
jgi:hypothetical protein